VERVRRVLLAVAVLAIAASGVYWFALRDSTTTTAEAQASRPVAQIGEGKRVTLVGDDGRLMGSASGEGGAAGKGPAKGGSKSTAHLPVLPLKQRPKGDRVGGHVLEQVHILAAAPEALGHYIAAASYGKTGVDIALTSGIEIRFGDDNQAVKKWKAAAAVLADPSVTQLSYVDVHAPTRPTKGGEGHELPPAS
jgi:hypothetical protein